MLLARQEIQQVVFRYCRGIDRVDMDLVRSAYHSGAIDHHTGFEGELEDYLAWVEPALRRLGGTMHVVGNHLAEVQGDDAAVETYATAYHWGTGPEGAERSFTTGVRYVDHMKRLGGRWAIAERWAVREWIRHEATTPVDGADAITPHRTTMDAIYRLRDRLGLGPLGGDASLS